MKTVFNLLPILRQRILLAVSQSDCRFSVEEIENPARHVTRTVAMNRRFFDIASKSAAAAAWPLSAGRAWLVGMKSSPLRFACSDMTTRDTRPDSEPQAGGTAEPGETVSFSLGLHRCVGNAVLYRRLLDRFVATRLSVPDEIRSLWLDGKLTESAIMAHSMISTAGTLGATALSEAARALQHALARDPGQVDTVLRVFSHEHALALAAIRKHIGA